MEQLELLEKTDVEHLCRECATCKQIKNLSEFYKDKSYFMGYKTICKDCFRKQFNKTCTHYTHEELMEIIKGDGRIPGKYFTLTGYVTSVVGEDGISRKIKRYSMICDCGRDRLFLISDVNRSGCCAHPDCEYSASNRKALDSIIKESIGSDFFIKKSTWDSYVENALERDIEFLITAEDVLNIWIAQEGRCNKSGHKLSAGHKKQIDSHTWSINRKDSKKGYTKDNIELTAKFVNILHNKYDNEPVDLYCMKRIIWLMSKDKDYVEQLKNICRMDEEDPGTLDEKWKTASKIKSVSSKLGIAKRPIVKIEEKIDSQNEISE